jgi:hypothetical protein
MISLLSSSLLLFSALLLRLAQLSEAEAQKRSEAKEQQQFRDFKLYLTKMPELCSAETLVLYA